jgi:pimeloyl-ACP methyl ester carboxylesterase
VTRIAVNGISINVEQSGDGSGPALLLLHGFTRDHREWDPLLACFDRYRTIRVDLIGHGKSDSPAAVARYSMAHAVDDLMALLHHLEIERTALLGYSLGGRVALHLAAEAPELLWALVLESASPGIEDRGERAARAASDEELALSIEIGSRCRCSDRSQACRRRCWNRRGASGSVTRPRGWRTACEAWGQALRNICCLEWMLWISPRYSLLGSWTSATPRGHRAWPRKCRTPCGGSLKERGTRHTWSSRRRLWKLPANFWLCTVRGQKRGTSHVRRSQGACERDQAGS